MYIDSRPKTENWVKLETSSKETELATELIPGKVLNINPQKGFAFFKPDTNSENVFVPPHLVSNHSLFEGMHIQVEVEKYTDIRTNELKNRVKRIEL